MAEFIEDEDNKPFTSAEQQRIVEVLEGIKRQAAKEHELDEHQLRMLTGIFDSLSESARHDSRNTWLVMAISVVSGPIITPEGSAQGSHRDAGRARPAVRAPDAATRTVARPPLSGSTTLAVEVRESTAQSDVRRPRSAAGPG
jgi:hypothetical protein